MSKRVFFAVLGAFLLGVVLLWFLQNLSFTAPPGPGGSSEGRGSRSAQRVICMSPAVTEIIFALAQGDRVVGVSQYSTYPPEALKKPQCGGFINPNTELIVALRPDLVITQGTASDLIAFCRSRGIAVASLDLTDLDSIFSAINEVGRVLGCEPEAERLCSRIRLELARIRLQVADKKRPRVFVVIGREPDSLKNLQTIGSSSFLHDLVELAGGHNVFRDLSKAYPTVSKESLVQRQAEVIIELRGEGTIGEREMARIVETWSAMAALPAVRNGRVHAVGSTYALIPGPRIVRLAEELAATLHPAGGE